MKRTSAVTLAHSYDCAKHSVHDGTWVVSEKLDGIRMRYDVQTGQCLTRNNKRILVPPEWLAMFQKLGLPFDGELMSDEGFKATTEITRRTVNTDFERWRQSVNFYVFDLVSDSPVSFRGRYFEIQKRQTLFPKWIRIVDQIPITSDTDLEFILEFVTHNGSEGLMLKNTLLPYEFRRSNGLLKMKRFQDEEAVVIAHVLGKGRHSHRVGKYICQLLSNDNAIFSCGTGFSDKERELPFENGTIITVKYFELTENSIPRFPTFVGVRDDIDVVKR